jgi:hypothetical protein
MQGGCGSETSGCANPVAASGAPFQHVIKSCRSLMSCGRGVAVDAGMSARTMRPAAQPSVRRASGSAATTTTTTVALTTTATASSGLATVALRGAGLGGTTHECHKVLRLGEHHGGFASLQIGFRPLERAA